MDKEASLNLSAKLLFPLQQLSWLVYRKYIIAEWIKDSHPEI